MKITEGLTMVYVHQDAVDCATEALEKFNIEKDIAAHIKKVCITLPLNQ